jgi:hypothetical protein
MTFFQSKGVAVNATTGVLNAAQGFIALRQAELAGDPVVSNRLTGTKEAIDFVSGLGMTEVHEVGGNGGFAGNPTLFVDLKPYDQAMDLWRQRNLKHACECSCIVISTRASAWPMTDRGQLYGRVTTCFEC